MNAPATLAPVIIAPIGFQKREDHSLIVIWSDRKRSEFVVRDLLKQLETLENQLHTNMPFSL